MEPTVRESDIEAVFGQLREISRRSTARSRSIETTLTFVEDSLLRFIAASDGARATDIASAFALNRSTVSRQINTLITMGLVQYREQHEYQEHERQDQAVRGTVPNGELNPDPNHAPSPASSGRGRILALTESGEVQLATSTRVHQSVVKDRLAGWSDPEIATFAAALTRYNEVD
ncbi:MarR family winged helix-turn-helix transcriptional regulator [Arthrobacter alpinus]|uniref:MarR family winged helix-turn-helix transcriptional regulator n=1 Tax=Arthrobacter alpinus TaxID=656366 RepID=UPI0009E9B066|nr:helix-turn-helix domain-containing protein [Arthrobacter alpinus]